MQRKKIVPPFKFWPERGLIKCVVSCCSHLHSAGHTDHSEENLRAPLLSISLGQPAIFLIGGSSLATVPTAVLLRSGDVLLMERESRLAYHAVPRILVGPAGTEQHQDFVEETFQCGPSVVRNIILTPGGVLVDWLETIFSSRYYSSETEGFRKKWGKKGHFSMLNPGVNPLVEISTFYPLVGVKQVANFTNWRYTWKQSDRSIYQPTGLMLISDKLNKVI